MVTIVIAVLIVIVIAIFALQNAAPVSISFILWKIEASVAIIIFLCTIAGIIIGMIFSALLRLKFGSRF